MSTLAAKAVEEQDAARLLQHEPGVLPSAAATCSDTILEGGGQAGGGDHQQEVIERVGRLVKGVALRRDQVHQPDLVEHADELAQEPGQGKDGGALTKDLFSLMEKRLLPGWWNSFKIR